MSGSVWAGRTVDCALEPLSAHFALQGADAPFFVDLDGYGVLVVTE